MPEQVYRIPLTQGKFAIVDESDYKSLSQWKWCAARYGDCWYAMRGVRIEVDGRIKTVGLKMHRVILGCVANEIGDHVNGMTLDNRRSNLRKTTAQGNARNCRKSSANTSGVKGVCWKRDKHRWVARLTVSKKKIHLGYFREIGDAERAYHRAARKIFGEFMREEAA
jgi:hypothetical protein